MRFIKPLAAAVGLCASSLVFANTQLSVDTAKPGPVINKNIYGQFAEHLGRGVYEGMWVGPDSKIPNVRGWRKDVIGALKELNVPLVRWPGGCFADEYHWRDGIGPRDKRPVKVNTNWGGVEENNAVGTHEFFDLAEQLGAETYVNGNLGTGTSQEMAEWLEYMTAEGKSTLAELRRKNGRDKPFRVHYFAIGNEAWGCGGNMTPEFYTHLYKQYASFLKAPDHNKPKLIASGGHSEDTSWADHLTASVKSNWSLRMDAVSFHYYTLPRGDWKVKGAALGFPEAEWMSTLVNTLKMDQFIINNKKVMDKNDPQKTVGFYVDEWGTWYDVEKGENPGFLYQQNSLRDAIVAALNFNIFHKHADRVHMTNIAQMVNVLQAMILTDKEKMILTPTYHAYKMYVPFQDATALPLELKDVPQYTLGKESVPAVSATAARTKDGKIYLALVNANPNKAETVNVNLAGVKINSVSGQVLTAKAMDAHNTFAAPNNIKPENYSANASNGKLALELPAKSVVVVEIK
ncbi:MAG TPA: alpha-L-arabinofuranosidase C-terminal domain-containing protein [Cellvibrio sp.]|nr:alpha-L-arabinofuranosidase C-terminal domain-containing protein [Cellvibrio sp.]